LSVNGHSQNVGLVSNSQVSELCRFANRKRHGTLGAEGVSPGLEVVNRGSIDSCRVALAGRNKFEVVG
jgi:hypothetical protein